MPEFTYVAIAKDGHKETSTINAANLSAAGHQLKEQGLLPIELKEVREGNLLNQLKSFSTISLDEKIGFIDNLGIMLKAGISISRSMQILVKQTQNQRMKGVLSDVYTQVQQGKSLGDALDKHPTVFSNIFVSMVRVGDLGGNLDKSLEYLSIQLHREADLKSKVKGAMIYPSVIVGAMIVIGVLMSIFVLPNLTSVFKDFKTDLPATTRAVMALADFMSAHAVLAIGSMIGTFVGFFLFLRTQLGQLVFDNVMLRFPIINPIVKKVNLARFSRILGSLLKSGIPIVQGLEVSADSLGNVLYKNHCAKAALSVKLGKPLAESLGSNTLLFPVLVSQMLQVGEESGTVQEILEQLAVHYEEEVDTTLRNMSSIIEPLLLLVIGGVVGILAMALIAPIYNISQSIQ